MTHDGVEGASYGMGSSGMIFDIQRFALHDGPGIRSTVFFKGCSCACAWCHNPESLTGRPQVEFYPSRCIGCGKCFTLCPRDAHHMGEEHSIDRTACDGCGICTENCFADALVLKGVEMPLEDALRPLLADSAYYRQSGGGVTLSGGEPVLQSAFALELLRALKEQGIHTALQTAGSYPFSLLAPLLPYLDLVLYDFKALDEDIHRKYIRGNRQTMLSNLLLLDEQFQGDLAVRTPVIGGVNDTEREIGGIARAIAGLSHLRYYQLMPYHGLGEAKYQALGESFEDFYTPPPEAMAKLERVAAGYVPVFNQDQGFISSAVPMDIDIKEDGA